MKHSICVALLISTALFSCSHPNNKDLLYSLNNIQAMGDTLPLLAMYQLDSIKPLFENESEHLRNRARLLEIRLRDKAHIRHTTDNEIKNVYNYFKSHGNAKELQEAYYYMGSTYRDLNDYPKAVTNFLKSASIANNSSIDSTLLQKTYSQLSYLYNAQFNYSEALKTILKGLAIAEAKNMANERTYINVANCYSKVNDTIQAIIYTELALKRIESKGISADNADIIASAMSKYSRYGYKEKATHCFALLQQLPKERRPFNYLANVTLYYDTFISADSAAAARLELYNTSSQIKSKYDAARWLTKYYTSNGNYEKAIEFAIKFIEANEAVIKQMNIEHTTNAKNFFQYQRDKEEEMLMIQRVTYSRLNSLIELLLFIVIILVGTIIYYRHKKQLLCIILKKEENIKQIRALMTEKDSELAEEKREIEKKEKELSLLNSTNSKLSKKLQDAENEFKMLIAQNRELTRITLMNNISVEATDIIEKVKKASKGKYRLNDEEWKELLGAIDKFYPEFTYEVQSKFKKINEPMLRVCYLMKIGLSGPQIVNLTDYPRQTVWERIKRIEKVIAMEYTKALEERET